VSMLFQFPKKVKEVSGIIWHNNLIWSIQDSGNSNEVFGFSISGEMKEKVEVKGASNVDWEDITTDKTGNLYIGDFGNNDNDRKNLAIYKLAVSDYGKVAEKVTFYYPEQKDFPAKKKDKLYDCEAFFLYQNHFYLFTKNRSKGFDGTSLIYKIPAVAGNHVAKLIGKIKTCSSYNSCVITGAAISPDEKKVVLLSHDRIWLLENYKDDNFSAGTMTEFELNHYSQKEGVCFKNNETLLIADEKDKKTGGNLYEVNLKKLKSKS
ncbi:hypothetical protein, partial [uncultured Flavobacterium sp.]|uniref:hypothetical protein n=1 Tax=uncultured Flavobacterium sp. TaxID=165435 RepID=UPI002611BB79